MNKKLTALSIAAALFSNVAISGVIDVKMASSSDSGVSNQDQITNVYNPEFVGKTDKNSDVTVSLNGNEFKAVTDSNGIFKWQSTPLQDGQYELIAESNNGSLASSRFIIDTATYLTVEFVIGTESTRFSGTSEPANDVYLTTLSGLSFNTRTDNSGKWLIDIPRSKLGHQDFIEIETSDIAGNISSKSFPYNDEPVRDHYLDAQLSESTDSGVLHDAITNINKNLQFDGSTSPDSKVTLSLNGLEFTTTASNSGLWSVTVPNMLADGQYDWRAKSENTYGDLELFAGNLIIDTYSPQIDFTNDPIMSGHDDVVISGAVSEGAKVEISLDGATYMTYTDYEWDINVGKLPEGQYQFRAVATDVAGNQGMSFSDIIVLK